jgi:Holliday junction resolvase
MKLNPATVERRRIANGTFSVDLPKPLSVNNLFVNNPKTHGRFPSAEYRAWKKEAALMLMAQRPRVSVGPVDITITVQESRGDIDNRIKCVIDCLVQNGIIDGDTNKTVRKVTAEWGGVIGARVEIRPSSRAPARVSTEGETT